MNRKKQETQPARGGDVAETLATYGASSLSDADLLSLMLEDTSILRATEVLAMSHGLNDLLRKSRAELLCIDLLTESEANRLAILMEVLRRSSRCDEPILVNTPRAAAAFLLPTIHGLVEERFGILALNAKKQVVAHRTLAVGTATACLVSPREVFREALRCGALSIIAYHSHPSGDPSPSREDIALTDRLVSAGESVGVSVDDHIVLGRETYFSFRCAQGWDSLDVAPQDRTADNQEAR